MDLAHQTTFPDYCLRSFLFVGLNAATRAQLSGEGPRGGFSSYVEWVLVSCNAPITIVDAASPTPDPGPSPVPPRDEEWQDVPTADGEKTSAAKPEGNPSDQVCEATDPSEGVLVEFKGREMSPAHPPATETRTIGHSASQGSLGALASPGSDVAMPPPQTCEPFAALWHSTPSASASSAFPQASPPPSVAPAPPLASGSLLPPRGVVVETPSRLPRSSVSLHPIGLPSTRWASSSSSSPSVVPKVTSDVTPPGFHPPATPPWGILLAWTWILIGMSLLEAILWLLWLKSMLPVVKFH
ncbi:uncharacterized protein [Pseudorasbora parva]|uniref:uncharacterized protein n=1 Tax=Pseudorasbora parva TaxID=51549 RepID=UPI00351E2255